jgi:DNA-binding CsgD family transcriptional regulator
VYERSEGNPLFVLELLRLVAVSGSAGRLPDTVSEVIGRRLDRLAGPTRAVLRSAAVLGREFTTCLLGAVLNGAVPPERLDEAVAQGLLVAYGQGWRFDHVLTQEVLYEELARTDRERLHARAAQALLAGDSLDALAHHLRQAAGLGGAEQALEVTRRAAERARNQFAYEHAAFQCRQALELLRLLPGGAGLRAELLLELARCQLLSGAVEEAWQSCREAADLGRAAGDAAVVADAATVLRGITNSPVTQQLHVLSREALAALRGTDPVREARVLAQLAVTADPLAGDAEPGLSQRALRAAEAVGDPEARFLAMQARQTELVNGEYVLQRLSLGERAVRLGAETGRDEYAAWGHSWRMDAFWELGRRVQGDAERAALSQLVEHMKEPLWRWRLTMVRASLALYEGRYDTAWGLADEALAIGRRGGHEAADFFHLVFSSELASQTGTGLDAVESRVREFVARGPYLARVWLAELLAGTRRLDETADLWEAVRPHLAEVPRTMPEWLVIGVGSTQVCVRLSDRETAAAIYPDLLPYADRLVAVGCHTPMRGPVALYLGMLATLLGDWEPAAGYLRTALAISKTTGSPPYQVYTHLHTARLLLARRGQGDLDAALTHLDAALRLARQLGMAPPSAEAAALREAASAEHKPLLSSREEQVAALVAEGLSNRQIATRLHLSERTAENHVAHILTKLGFDSRARIASWYATQRRD